MIRQKKSIEPIKSLDELSIGDVVRVKNSIRDGIYIVDAIGDVPEHEKEIVLNPIHCVECPDSQVDYYRKVVHEGDLEHGQSRLQLTKVNREDYKNWRYAGLKSVK